MMLSWRQMIPMLFTLAAMVVGFYSMLMSAAGEYVQAAQLIMVSMILDGLDGTLARALKGTTQIGAELDTFVDMTSFGLAPALMAYQAVLKDFGVWGFLLASAIVLSGVYRLSRFRVVDPYRGQRGYLGLPITTNAGWMASFFIATECGQIDRDWFALDHGPIATLFWATTLVMLVLQISRVRYCQADEESHRLHSLQHPDDPVVHQIRPCRGGGPDAVRLRVSVRVRASVLLPTAPSAGAGKGTPDIGPLK